MIASSLNCQRQWRPFIVEGLMNRNKVLHKRGRVDQDLSGNRIVHHVGREHAVEGWEGADSSFIEDASAVCA